LWPNIAPLFPVKTETFLIVPFFLGRAGIL